MTQTGPLLPRRDAASYIGLAPATLAKLAVFGGGPDYLKLGRSVRYRQSALDAWLVARTVTNTSEAQSRGLDALTPAAT